MTVKTKEDRLKERREAKQAQQQKNFMNSMISRSEAVNVAQAVSRQEIDTALGIIQPPLKGAIIQAMAIFEALVDKGIIVKEEFDKYLALAQANIEKATEAKHAEKEVEGGAVLEVVEDSAAEETQEQQG